MGGLLAGVLAMLVERAPAGHGVGDVMEAVVLGRVRLSLRLSSVGVHLGSVGGYALVGMAAATAATTHAPLMAAVMVFELSGDYSVALPLVLPTAIATLVSRRLGRESIYTAELRQRGISWKVTMEGRCVADQGLESRQSPGVAEHPVSRLCRGFCAGG